MIYTAALNSAYDASLNSVIGASTNATLAAIVWSPLILDFFLVDIAGIHYWEGAPNSDYDIFNNDQIDALHNVDLAGITSSDVLMCESLAIEHEIDGRSSANLTIFDETGILQFSERQQIIIAGPDNEKEFAGVLQSSEETRIPGTSIVFHALDATDYTALLDWRLCDYAVTDMLAGQAVREILGLYLADEGITEGYIESGELLSEISIGNKSISEGFIKLAEACDFICYVDYNLNLYFHRRSLYSADWSISDGTDILSESLIVTRNNPKYRNSETVIGGFEETALQTEQFVGDGTTKTFPLGYPFNRISTVTVDGFTKTVGQKGTDTGYEVYFAPNSETMTFDSGIAAPANGKVIEVKYYGLWRAKTKQSETSAINANKARQGFGSGKIEHITIDETLVSVEAASEYANAKLAQYAVDGISIKYETRRAGLAAGTLQAIDYAGLDDDFLITRIRYTRSKDKDVVYTVEAVSGPVNESWEAFFRSQFQAIYTIREGVETSGVTNVYNFSHEYEVADRPNPFTEEYSYDGTRLNSEYDASLNSDLDALTNLWLDYQTDPYTLVSEDTWPCFDPLQRAEYIELWIGATHFRKAHTQVINEEGDDIDSYTYISPSEAIGAIDHVKWFGGDSATSVAGTGVEIYSEIFAYTKSILLSLQLNMSYINGES